jgi:hypothetical protein
MDISAVGSGFSALQGLRAIATTLLEVRDFTKLAGIQGDLQQKILDVQGAMLDLQATLSAKSDAFETLKARTTQLENAARERERYELYEIRPGAFVYRRREEVPPIEPRHYLCQQCFDKGVKAVMRSIDSAHFGPRQQCPVCKDSINL